MQAVAVVVNRNQRLQCGAAVVELDLLRVWAAASGLDMELQLLAALLGAVLFLHRHGPNAVCDAAHHRSFRIHGVAEEKAQVRSGVVNVHAARQVCFNNSKTIAQGEGEADGVGACLGNVITADRNAVKIAHPVMSAG